MKPQPNAEGTVAVPRSRFLDYLTLVKPELTLLSVCTALVSCYMADAVLFPSIVMLHVFVGTLLIGSGAGALNQYMEREFDALMRRTQNRPLPSGRVYKGEVILFGTTLSISGVVYLFVSTNLITAFLGAVTLTSYLFLYTPLKRITPLSTLVGGLPGALPPVIGWTAVSNELTIEAGILFFILFFWQMPHFYSLSWMYRKDYEKAGYPMLSVVDADGTKTSAQLLINCGLLIPVSILLTMTNTVGTIYGLVAFLLGSVFLVAAWRFYRDRSNSSARMVFFASLLYLPALMLTMALDKL